METYKTIATYALATLAFLGPAAVARDYDTQKIDGYSVTTGRISQGDFPYATIWEDTNGDEIFDRKTRIVSVGLRGAVTADLPFEKSDRQLTDELVAKLK